MLSSSAGSRGVERRDYGSAIVMREDRFAALPALRPDDRPRLAEARAVTGPPPREEVSLRTSRSPRNRSTGARSSPRSPKPGPSRRSRGRRATSRRGPRAEGPRPGRRPRAPRPRGSAPRESRAARRAPAAGPAEGRRSTSRRGRRGRRRPRRERGPASPRRPRRSAGRAVRPPQTAWNGAAMTRPPCTRTSPRVASAARRVAAVARARPSKTWQWTPSQRSAPWSA